MEHITDYIELLASKSNDELLKIIEQIDRVFKSFGNNESKTPYNLRISRDVVKLVMEDRNLVQ